MRKVWICGLGTISLTLHKLEQMTVFQLFWSSSYFARLTPQLVEICSYCYEILNVRCLKKQQIINVTYYLLINFEQSVPFNLQNQVHLTRLSWVSNHECYQNILWTIAIVQGAILNKWILWTFGSNFGSFYALIWPDEDKIIWKFSQQSPSLSSVTYLRTETIESVEDVWHSSKEHF